MVRADAGRDRNFQVLALLQAVGCEVAGVEATHVTSQSACRTSNSPLVSRRCPSHHAWYSRSCNYHLGINHFLLEDAVLPLFVRGGDQRVTLILEPFPDAELVLSGSQKLWFLLSVLTTLVRGISKVTR